MGEVGEEVPDSDPRSSAWPQTHDLGPCDRRASHGLPPELHFCFQAARILHYSSIVGNLLLVPSASDQRKVAVTWVCMQR